MPFVYLKKHLVQAYLILLVFALSHFADILGFFFYKLRCQMVVSMF